MRLVILDTYDEASVWAAKYIKARINEFNPGPKKQFILGLPTGEIIMRGLFYTSRQQADIECTLVDPPHVEESTSCRSVRAMLVVKSQDLETYYYIRSLMVI